MTTIDTDKISKTLRSKAINVAEKRVLVTRLGGSEQEKDITEPVNCGGYGRVRHFRRQTSQGWPENPLPIDPAAHKLQSSPSDLLRAQVFQNAACNWRCWYCFVPFSLLAANPNKSAWLTVGEMLDLYQQTADAPRVIDLSGGQPDLTPEWIPWMMRELLDRGLDRSVYLWSDDNLSNDYMTRFLRQEDFKLMREYRNYGKVCCFKGFDHRSFAFNTGAAPELFDRQFEIYRKHLDLGLDLYAYVTFTSPTGEHIREAMRAFVDRLQSLHPKLPLRTIPLEIRNFTPMDQRRLQSTHEDAIRNQETAVRFWNDELENRFSPADRSLPIYAVDLARN